MSVRVYCDACKRIAEKPLRRDYCLDCHREMDERVPRQIVFREIEGQLDILCRQHRENELVLDVLHAVRVIVEKERRGTYG